MPWRGLLGIALGIPCVPCDSSISHLQWRHKRAHPCVSNHRQLYCFFNSFRITTKKISNPRHSSADEFPSQRTSNAENVSRLWSSHVMAWINSFYVTFQTTNDGTYRIWHKKTYQITIHPDNYMHSSRFVVCCCDIRWYIHQRHSHHTDVKRASCPYCDVIMGAMASQITSLTIVYSTVHSGADQRKHQSFASLAFVRGIHRWPVNSPHKGPVTRRMFPFDDVIMAIMSLYPKHCSAQ